LYIAHTKTVKKAPSIKGQCHEMLTEFSRIGFPFDDASRGWKLYTATVEYGGPIVTKKVFWIRVPLESIHFHVKVAKIGENKFLGHYWFEERSWPSLVIHQKYKLNFVKKIHLSQAFPVFSIKTWRLAIIAFFQLKLEKPCDRCILSLR
jgi:hypothetical protein